MRGQGQQTCIGMIGAGPIGGTLTRGLTTLGHKIFVANFRVGRHLSICRWTRRRQSRSLRRLAAENWLSWRFQWKVFECWRGLFEGVSDSVAVHVEEW